MGLEAILCCVIQLWKLVPTMIKDALSISINNESEKKSWYCDNFQV